MKNLNREFKYYNENIFQPINFCNGRIPNEQLNSCNMLSSEKITEPHFFVLSILQFIYLFIYLLIYLFIYFFYTIDLHNDNTNTKSLLTYNRAIWRSDRGNEKSKTKKNPYICIHK